MTELHDMHCHLDFMANGEEVARDAAAAGALLFATTVTPDGYVRARERFGAFGNVRVGVGLHPWWVRASAAGAAEADRVVEFVAGEHFVGEIGLDFGKRYVETRKAQMAAFSQVAAACGAAGGKVLSIHSVRAAREVLDVLGGTGALESCTCIFHWYSGPSDQLKRAIDAGCLFSVNVRMLATGKGREYVKAIPARQLLLETDAPPGRDAPYSWELLRAELADAAAQVAAIKGAAALDTIAANAQELPHFCS